MDKDPKPTHKTPLTTRGSHFHAVFNSPFQFFWLLTADGTLIEANGTALTFVASARDEIAWLPFWDTPWWGQDVSSREQLRHAIDLAGEGEPIRFDAEIWGADEQVITLDFTLRPYREAGGKVTLLIAEGRNISDIRDAQERIAESGHRYTTLLNALDEGIVLQDHDRRIDAINLSALRILDLDPDAPYINGDTPFVWHVFDENEQDLPLEEHPSEVSFHTGLPQRAILGIRRNDDIAWIEITTRPLTHPAEQTPYAVLSSLSDVTELRRQREMLQHQAQHDPLTNLPNRKSFFEALTKTAGDGNEPYGVMYLDLDGFKDVNDTLGHAAGDQLLVRFSRRLERSVRPFDLVARLAGDEFAVLLRRVGPAENAVRVAERILTQTNTPFSLTDGHADVSTSIGIALGRNDDDPDRVVRDADFALRHAKVAGKNRYAIFDEHLSRNQEFQHRIASDLKRALPDGQLEVHYQPLVDARDKRVVGAEALMRWRHPERGLIPPEEFVPIAERIGEIVSMEGWLIHTALTQLDSWNEEHPGFKVSVNLSGRQLEQSEFPTTFAGLLAETGVNPENLVLEITETYAMQRPREVGKQLRALADLGVTLAIDDFGTGYSNLGHLQHLPFRIVKIDRSFLENVPEDQRNFALVRTIIAMAQALDLEVVAEGVETKTQAEFLYWEGATWLQGFYFGKPIEAVGFSREHLSGLEEET